MTPLAFDLPALWRYASAVHVEDGFAKNLFKRARFVWGAPKQTRMAVEQVVNAPEARSFAQALHQDPRLAGYFEWPFLNIDYSVPQRFEMVSGHMRTVAEQFPWLNLAPFQALTLLDLGTAYPDLRIVVEYAPWFIREGCLNFSMLLRDDRLMTLCFTLGQVNSQLTCYLGSIQGHAGGGAVEVYKSLAQTFQDIRPRDFVFKILRMFTEAIGVESIHCIADANRVHNHAFFGGEKDAQLHLKYDDIWAEQGGVANGAGYVCVAAVIPERPLSDVPQKKRGRYKRRIEMFQHIQAQLKATIAQVSSAVGKA
jgi:uncharacterized protein VirK/YbjX